MKRCRKEPVHEPSSGQTLTQAARFGVYCFPSGRDSHLVLCGSDCVQFIVSVTPDAISAQAPVIALSSAALSLFADTVLQAVCPLYVIQSSRRYFAPPSVEYAIRPRKATTK